MKDIITYINESCNKIDREEVAEKYPNFWKAVSQFCRDKNSEKGVDYIIGAWLCDSPEDFEKKFPNPPFNGNELKEFEENYMNDEAYKEIENK